MMFFLDAVNVLTIRLFLFRLTPVQKELIEELLVIVVFIPLAYVLLGPGHIKTELLKSRMRGITRFSADMLTSIALLVLSVVCFLATGSGALHAIESGSVKMGDVQFPLSPFYVMLSFGFLLLSIATLLIMIKQIFTFIESRKNKEKEYV
jgi:TRAP-type C4-dicarboxylate transport system permease small subunit